MTRIFCNSKAVSDRMRGRPGAFRPGAAPYIDASVLSLESTRGLVCRSPRTLWWNDHVLTAAATSVLQAPGAPLRPTTIVWPSLSASKRVYSTDGASRPEEHRHGLCGAVSRRTDGTSIQFGDVDRSEPGTQKGCGRSSPRRLQPVIGEWRNLRRSDVRVVAEKNGQATVATDTLHPTRL